MNAETNLLFGVIAFQVGLITSEQFAEACTIWTSQRNEDVSEALVRQGWISEKDKFDVERIVQRKLDNNEGDVTKTIGEAVTNPLHRTLAGLNNPEGNRFRSVSQGIS